jgi:hypothetical protein
VEEPEYEIGDRVEKFTGDYSGEGEIRGYFYAWEGGPLRYIVKHTLEGGRGYLCHIYSPKNLRRLESD